MDLVSKAQNCRLFEKVFLKNQLGNSGSTYHMLFKKKSLEQI